MLNKNHTDETKQKIREKKLGQKHTNETKKKMSISHIKYPIETITKAINLRKDGLSWIKISKTMNISDSTIRSWCKRYDMEKELSENRGR